MIYWNYATGFEPDFHPPQCTWRNARPLMYVLTQKA